MVEASLYRSSFPLDEHFPFLRTLQLRTAVVLSHERLIRSVKDFFMEQGIDVRYIANGAFGSNARYPLTDEFLKTALECALDADAQPLLIMSASGTHEVGAVVGCLRRLQGWALSSAFDEYHAFAAPSIRPGIEQTIELFDLQLIVPPERLAPWYAACLEEDAAEARWLAERCSQLEAEGEGLPAYLAHYMRFGSLISDPKQAKSAAVDSDDD